MSEHHGFPLEALDLDVKVRSRYFFAKLPARLHWVGKSRLDGIFESGLRTPIGSAIPASQRRRLMAGDIRSGEDVSALRRFVGLSQVRFAEALGISVHTLRNWEQDRRRPEGPALALLRIAARHPRIIRENLEHAA